MSKVAKSTFDGKLVEPTAGGTAIFRSDSNGEDSNDGNISEIKLKNLEPSPNFLNL